MNKMNNRKRIVIIGATSRIAEHCVRLWAERYILDLILTGRNSESLAIIAQDIKVRSPSSSVEIQTTNFTNSQTIETFVADVVFKGVPDIVLIAHGSLPSQTGCQTNLSECEQALAINALSPALFAEAFAQHLEKENSGTLAIIGSVAGDRGRKSNYVYGSAKGLIDRYTQGLQHRFSGTGVRIVLIKPGPTDTPMTKQYKEQGMSLAKAEDVAKDIVKGIEKKKTVIYTPIKWMVIMFVIRHLPHAIFNKLNI